MAVQIYQVSFIQEICQNSHVQPLESILNSLALQDNSLVVKFAPEYRQIVIFKQQDKDLTAINQMIRQSQYNITHFKMQGYSLSIQQWEIVLKDLSQTFLKQLTLNQCQINDKTIVNFILNQLKDSNIVELDLSNNTLIDKQSKIFVNYFTHHHKITHLDLSSNNFQQADFGSLILYSESLEHLSLSNNPLSFCSFYNILQSLTYNKILRILKLSNIIHSGPAPLKENPNGHLTCNEATILQLAYSLRYCKLNIIEIDLDPDSRVQLYEVETTLIKYNKTLYSLVSNGVDWAEFNIGVEGISRGLRANKCVQGIGIDKLESDTEELVRDKKFFGSEGVSGYSDIFSKSDESAHKQEKMKNLDTPQFSPGKYRRFDNLVEIDSDKVIEEEKPTVIQREHSFGKTQEQQYKDKIEQLIQNMRKLEDDLVNQKTTTEQRLSSIENNQNQFITKLQYKVNQNTESLQKFEKKIGLVEEQSYNIERLKDIVNELFNKIDSQNSFNNRRSSYAPQQLEDSFEQDNLSNKLQQLSQRIARLEQDKQPSIPRHGNQNTLDTSLDSLNSQDSNCPTQRYVQTRSQTPQSQNYTPGKVESLVMQAITDRARGRSPMQRSIGFVNKPSQIKFSPHRSLQWERRSSVRGMPSSELQMYLRNKGFQIKEGKPVFMG